MHTLELSHSEAVTLLKHLEVCLPECCRQMLLHHPGRILLPLQGKKEELESRFTAVDVAAQKSHAAARSSLFMVLALRGVWLENGLAVDMQTLLMAQGILPSPFISNFLFFFFIFFSPALHNSGQTQMAVIPSDSVDSISLGMENLLCEVPQDFIFLTHGEKREDQTYRHQMT